MTPNRLDKLIAYFSPRSGLARLAARATMQQIEALTGGNAGYNAGKVNRLTHGRFGSNINENAVPREQVDRLRWQSWDLWRNNPHARKIVRTLEAKVVGVGLHLQSQAMRADGTAHVEFRERAKLVYEAACKTIDTLGLPGRGGQSMCGLQKQALRSVVLSGELLYQPRLLTIQEARERGATVPIELRMIHAARLVGTMFVTGAGVAPGNRVFRGIEVTPAGRRAAYWLLNTHPSEAFLTGSDYEAHRIPADQIGHLYVAEDVDQLRGVPWFAAAIMQMGATGDYQFNELKASALASCVVMGYRRGTGQTQFGTAVPDDWDLTDADGNKITAMQPGMLLDLGQNGAIEGFNPSRPSTSAEAWINHMIRSTSTALPGVKSSTLTGDYRNSSFSSERSADNDAWPELNGIQEWMAEGFCQPIYQQIIRAALLAGLFDDVIDTAEYMERESELVAATWQGPVALSINPVDDADAARARVRNGTSSPQREASKVGGNCWEIMSEVKEYIERGLAVGLPEDFVYQAIGIDQLDQPEQSEALTGQASETIDETNDTGTNEQDTKQNQLAAVA